MRSRVLLSLFCTVVTTVAAVLLFTLARDSQPVYGAAPEPVTVCGKPVTDFAAILTALAAVVSMGQTMTTWRRAGRGAGS